jgi:hypothetical protein
MKECEKCGELIEYCTCCPTSCEVCSDNEECTERSSNVFEMQYAHCQREDKPSFQNEEFWQERIDSQFSEN